MGGDDKVPEPMNALPREQASSKPRFESDLALLRRRFDERLAALAKPEAGDHLRSVMRTAAKLRGRVKAGETY